MFESVSILLLALVIIFLAAEIFTNALEHLGERIGVSEGVTGSIFAAVGTAMPETIVPLVAILAGGASEAVNHEVGLGAILGAPFMLSTLSIGLMAWFAGRKRGWSAKLNPEPTGLKRDLFVFFFGYAIVVAAAFIPDSWSQLRVLLAFALFFTYFMYLLLTIKASRDLVQEGHATEADGALYFSRLLGDSTAVAALQLLAGLFLIIVGAKQFVHGVEGLSTLIGVSALVVSLLIIPIATELPEKVNSILWIRKGKDTLAFGNITGAMVFQGTVIPGAGMLLIPWNMMDSYAGMAVLLAIAGNGWLWLLHRTGRLTTGLLSGSMLLYACFIFYVLLM